MTLTNEEFKTRVAELFTDGSPITDDKFAALSEAITQLQQSSAGGGGELTVSVPEKYKDQNSGLDTRLQATVTKTDTGQNLELGVGPWFNLWLREIYARFPRAVELLIENKRYVMPEDLILSYGPTDGGYNDGGVLKQASRMAWRTMLTGARAIYAVNWNKTKSITVFDVKKVTKNTYSTESSNSLPDELLNEGVISKYFNFANNERWDVGRLTDSGGTLIVERGEPTTGETIKIIYKYSIDTHSSGVKFNEEGKFRHGEILNIYSTTFIEEYPDPTNTNTFKRRITIMT